MDMGMLYDLQNKNVFSLRLKVCGLAGMADIEWEIVPDFGGYYPEGSLAVSIAAKIGHV